MFTVIVILYALALPILFESCLEVYNEPSKFRTKFIFSSLRTVADMTPDCVKGIDSLAPLCPLTLPPL